MIKLMMPDNPHTYICILPNRGAIIIDYTFQGRAILYLDRSTIESGTSSIIRGGVPILFPVCGPVEANGYQIRDQWYLMPKHGFARDFPWEITSLNETKEFTSITLQLTSNMLTQKYYPYDFEMNTTYHLTGTELLIQTELANRSNYDMPFQLGFHPYFLLKDKNSIKLKLFAKECIDTLKGIRLQLSSDGWFHPDLNQEQINLCFRGFNQNHIEIQLDDHKVEIVFTANVTDIVLWAISGQDFICIEPWIGSHGDFAKNLAFRLSPGENFSATFTIRPSQIQEVNSDESNEA
ncbi:hypothetical protein LSG31_12380 [Fodinisporobacter ferrooxydans]|uniref:Aldose epimerase n=1 Tax=Fodinisporobacter ferrooxydans TaxID=2901836 RepID=A0ABY4CFE0_9BACL|nr:hypothetical protein LSG31_12380 [Alicyclobacillaceae bacterium MYW30-H2]